MGWRETETQQEGGGLGRAGGGKQTNLQHVCSDHDSAGTVQPFAAASLTTGHMQSVYIEV